MVPLNPEFLLCYYSEICLSQDWERFSGDFLTTKFNPSSYPSPLEGKKVL